MTARRQSRLCFAGAAVLVLFVFGRTERAEGHPATPVASRVAEDVDGTAQGGGPIWRDGLSCGPNAAYLLALVEYGGEVSYDELRAAVPVSEQGSSLADVADGLTSCGYPCKVVKARPADLQPAVLPMIVHLDRLNGSTAVGHYCVLARYDETIDEVVVIDAANGLQTRMNVDPFRRMWSGYAIVPTRPGLRTAAIDALIGLALVAFAVRLFGGRR